MLNVKTMLRFNKEQKYLFFDFETCHLNLADMTNKPWQLSYIITQGDDVLLRSDNFISWEQLDISPDAARITGFDWGKYKKLGKEKEGILKQFEKYLYDPQYLVAGQNVLGFDIYIHNIYRKLLGLKTDYSYLNRIIDTNCLAKAIKKGLKKNKDIDMLSWQLALNHFHERGLKTSLKAQLKDHCIEFDENLLHDSMYDIEMNFLVFKKQLWLIEI